MFKKSIMQLSLYGLLLVSGFLYAADDEIFFGESIRTLESAYKSAPFTVHNMVNTFLGKARSPYPFNYAIFDGEPGVGKSTLALAVAYKSARKVRKFSAIDFMTMATRNEAATEFNNTMWEISNIDEKTVIILEEVNHLLTNYDNKHHDTDPLAMRVWNFLDEIDGNKKVFFIGTTNGIGGFPSQMISRFKSCIVTIEAQKDLQQIKACLFEGFANEKINISNEAISYIDNNIDRLQGYNARDIAHLINEINVKIVELTPELYRTGRCIIQPEHIDAAFNEFVDLAARFQAKPYNETEIEQRERHHRESTVLAKESLTHQDEVAARQRLLTYVSLATGVTVTVGATAATIYFAYQNHLTMMDAQKSMHASRMAMQELLYQAIRRL